MQPIWPVLYRVGKGGYDMAAFQEVEFPLVIGFGATGGPERRTQIVTTASGREERNQQWANSRRMWDVGTGVRDVEEAEQVLAFFEDMRGQLTGFRFCDPLDLKSCPVMNEPTSVDQSIGIGDATQTVFQLVKIYGSTDPYYRKINKPIAGSVIVAVDGIALPGVDFSVDHATGLVTLTTAPAVGLVVSAGFKFHVPVRFDTDRLNIAWEEHSLISVPSIPILELVL